MKKKKWAVDGEKSVGSVAMFVKKYIKLDPSESLVRYKEKFLRFYKMYLMFQMKLYLLIF